MALLKQIVNDRGVVTNYHKVNNVSLSDNSLHFEVESYPTEEYRRIAQPADFIHYHFDITIEEEESMGIRKLCYAKLKKLEKWSEAEDC